MKEKLASFGDLPPGSKIRYPGSKTIYVIVKKYRIHSDNEPMSGTIVEWTGKLFAKYYSICTHFGGREDCPDEVYVQIDSSYNEEVE